LRRPVIAGNWKMYKTQEETRAFFAAFKPLVPATPDCDVIVAPPFTSLAAAAAAAHGSSITIAAQNAYWEREGAFTGEISVRMIADAGGKAVLIGHSERRQFFGETDETVLKKTKAALAAGLTPIVCIGEKLAEYQAGKTQHVCETQFLAGSNSLTPEEFSRILLAYEPVWAIGTGHTATPEIATAVHKFLRSCAAARFSESLAASLRILYGGSVKPDNIKGLMAQEELDGVLVGGASLDPKSFASIVKDWPR